MIEYIIGSKSKERIFFFLAARNEGYAREIAKFYDSELSPVQNQLNKLEIGNVLVCRTIGRTKVFSFNPRYPFFNELLQLIEKAIEFLPDEEQKRLKFFRKRPRRSGKPL